MKQWFDNISASKTFKLLNESMLYMKHPYVEIGGIKWATMNIGANSVTDYGLYFQWGDTQGYTASQVGYGEGQKNFGWNDYKWTEDDGSTFIKYTENGVHTLEATDDAVTAAWGGNWRMPTLYEFSALKAAVTIQWVTDYQGSGVSGMVLTDNTDSSKVLFFPACGIAGYGRVYDEGNYSGCWSSSLKADCGENYANRLGFGSCHVNFQSYSCRSYGFAVRGVLGA